MLFYSSRPLLDPCLWQCFTLSSSPQSFPQFRHIVCGSSYVHFVSTSPTEHVLSSRYLSKMKSPRPYPPSSALWSYYITSLIFASLASTTIHCAENLILCSRGTVQIPNNDAFLLLACIIPHHPFKQFPLSSTRDHNKWVRPALLPKVSQ